MSINIESRLARFNDLIPSKVPFVEGKLKGHQDRLNYSLVGPGVSEDSKQNVKIAEEHGFNIGAVSAAPMNGSGLHSHTTAEVFIIFSGSTTSRIQQLALQFSTTPKRVNKLNYFVTKNLVFLIHKYAKTLHFCSPSTY